MEEYLSNRIKWTQHSTFHLNPDSGDSLSPVRLSVLWKHSGDTFAPHLICALAEDDFIKMMQLIDVIHCSQTTLRESGCTIYGKIYHRHSFNMCCINIAELLELYNLLTFCVVIYAVGWSIKMFSVPVIKMQPSWFTVNISAVAR